MQNNLKNLLIPTFYNIGFIGNGKYNSVNNKYYQIWVSMIRRCYSNKYKLKNKTYENCSVIEIWHNFQNFALWCEENYIEGFHLDKDILFKNNKIYSPETCCFVPSEINSLFTKSNKSRGQYPIGISIDKRRNKFNANLHINKNFKCLGCFNTIEEAFQVYKEAKEKYIKWMALTWFVQKKQISEKVYQAMINYKVEITD